MKEIIVKIPEENTKLATQLLEKLGAEVSEKKTIKKTIAKKRKSSGKTVISKRKKNPRKIDHTFLFGKWKDFDIDPKKLRQSAW